MTPNEMVGRTFEYVGPRVDTSRPGPRPVIVRDIFEQYGEAQVWLSNGSIQPISVFQKNWKVVENAEKDLSKRPAL